MSYLLRQRIVKTWLLFFLAFPAVITGAQNEAAGQRGVGVISASALSGATGTTRALIIGISDYEDPEIPDLRFAHRDAEAFAEFLKSPGGGGISTDNIKILLNENASFISVIREIKKLTLSCAPGDRAIIYFSGHGDVENDMVLEQPGYLLCYDTPSDVYDAGALDVDKFQRYINEISIGKKTKILLITDACRSGKLAGNHVRGTMLTNSQLKERFANEVLFLSCQPNEFSVENERWDGGRGVFSYYLTNGLYGLADSDEDLQLRLKELRRYLEDHVPQEARSVSGLAQNPVVSGDMEALIAMVDKPTLDRVRETKSPVLAGSGTKGFNPFEFVADSSIQELYRAFQDAIAQGNLLGPEGRSANDFYERLIREDSIRNLHEFLALDLAAALINDSQQAINGYIRSQRYAVEFMRQSDLLKFSQYADYVARATELLGEDDFVYNQLKATESFFRARSLMVDIYLGRSTLAPAVQQRLFCSYCTEGLQYDSTASYLYAMLGHGNCNNQAVQNYRRALRLSPAWLQAYIWMAEEMEKVEGLNSALNTVMQALRMDSTYALGYRKLSELYVLLGDYYEAVRAGEQGIGLDSVYVSQWYNDWLPAAYAFTHQYPAFVNYRARQAAELADREDSELPVRGAQYLIDLGNYYLESANTREARNTFERAARLSAEPALQVRAQWGLAWAALLEGRYAEAETRFYQVDGPEGLTGLGLVSLKQGRQVLADSLLRQAILQGDSQQNSGLKASEAFILEANTVLAFAPALASEMAYLFELAAEVYPDNTAVMLHWAAVLKSPLGEYRKAVRLLETALSQEPQNPELHYALAATYARWGKPRKALDALEQAFSAGYRDIERLRADPDWTKLKNNKRFRGFFGD